MKISGRLIAKDIYRELAQEVIKLRKRKIIPQLVIVKTSTLPAVNAYVNQKVKHGHSIGVEVKIVRFNKLTRAHIIKKVQELNRDSRVHGIIFQKPSHKLIDDRIESLINVDQDVDGFLAGTPFYPPTYQGVLKVLEMIYKVSPDDLLDKLRGKNIVVIGKGQTGGKPIIDSLRRDNLDQHLSVIDSKTTTTQKEQLIREADIVISAVGKLNPVDPQWFSPQAILIDIGVHFEDGKIRGDFAEEVIKDRVKFYTTTPGGIGALTVVYLMSNVIKRASAISHDDDYAD